MMDVNGSWAAVEFAGAQLPDERFRRQLVANVERLRVHCGESFSTACGPAGRQAAKRLLYHRETSVEGLLAGHVEQTVARCAEHPLVLCLQDTTLLDFKTQPLLQDDLGPISTGRHSRGLLMHTCYLISPVGEPLGLVHCRVWTRDRDRPDQARQRRSKATAEKESGKWLESACGAQTHLEPGQQMVLISDRESDLFDYLAMPRQPGCELLCRAGQEDRRVFQEGKEEAQPLGVVAAQAPVVGQREIEVPRQAGRKARPATLTLRLCRIEVPAPANRKVNSREPQAYWLLQAAEEGELPEGITPLRWVLLTTLDPREDPGQLCEWYAHRWQIEVWHRTLKSGLGAEALQIEGFEALSRAVVLLGVVAWRVMQLTWLGREQAEAPAETALEPEALAVLCAVAKKPPQTVAEVVREIARLGGYEPYRNAPPPGAKRIWTGLRRLNDLVRGWRAARGGGDMIHG